MFGKCLCLALSFMMLAVTPVQAIIGGCKPSANDRRLDAVAAYGSVQSGVIGPCGYSNVIGAGVLIAPNMVITAAHNITSNWFQQFPTVPAAGTQYFRFRRTPDSSVASGHSSPPVVFESEAQEYFHVRVIEFRLASWIPAQSRRPDLAIAVLECNVNHIVPIPMRFVDPSDVEVDSPVVIASWGREEPPGWSGCPCTPSCPSSPQTPQTSAYLKQLKFAASEVSQVTSQDIRWRHACDPTPASCQCGAAAADSGGAVLIESPTCAGRFELVAIIQTPVTGQTLTQVQGDSALDLPGSYENPCVADINHDHTVDGVDLGVILNNWGPAANHLLCAADTATYCNLNCDSAIDGIDLGILLNNYGDCPGMSDACEGTPIVPHVHCGPGEGGISQEEQELLEEGSLQSGGGAFASGSQQAAVLQFFDDPFLQWASQASLQELLQWLVTGQYPGNP